VHAVRPLYLALSAVFFALAVLGAFLPLLPTTPFLLLTSGCLVRSSPTLHARLMRSRGFGPMLTDWERERGMRPRVKVLALATLVLGVGASVAFGHLTPALVWVVLGLGAIGAVAILRVKTIRTNVA